MNYFINVVKDSILISITMKIFKNKEDAAIVHIFKSKLVKIALSIFKN
jgi:hypothetical protein